MKRNRDKIPTLRKIHYLRFFPPDLIGVDGSDDSDSVDQSDAEDDEISGSYEG
jgi:hypothetical protein